MGKEEVGERMKTYIKPEVLIGSEKEITEEQYDKFIDDFVDLVESYGWWTFTVWGLHTEDELDEMEKDDNS